MKPPIGVLESSPSARSAQHRSRSLMIPSSRIVELSATTGTEPMSRSRKMRATSCAASVGREQTGWSVITSLPSYDNLLSKMGTVVDATFPRKCERAACQGRPLEGRLLGVALIG